MPKRSTPFQRAVYYMKSHLANGQYEVTESKYLRELSSGEDREVDVVLEAKMAGHSITIGMECREKGRKADKPWIESMWAKHADLPTDRLVLVSLSGFTETAKRKAERLAGVELLEPEQVTESNIAKIVSELVRFRIAKANVYVEQARCDMAATQYAEATTLVIERDCRWAILDGDGKELCNAQQLVDHLSGGLLDRPEIVEITAEWTNFRFGSHPKQTHEGEEGASIYMEQNNPTPHLVEIQSVWVEGRLQLRFGGIEMAKNVLQGVSHAYGEGTLDGARTAAFITALTDNTATVTLEIEGSHLDKPKSGASTDPGVGPEVAILSRCRRR